MFHPKSLRVNILGGKRLHVGVKNLQEAYVLEGKSPGGLGKSPETWGQNLGTG
jgi:hypothetical protein